jgi:hypothetical protein
MTSSLEPKVINLSLPKCGSTSIDRFCSLYCNSIHEIWHSGITDALVKHKMQLFPKSSLLNYFDFKYLATEVDVDSSTYNHFLLEDLLKRYPNTYFISVLRDPLGWCCSMLNMWGYFARIVDFARQDTHSYDMKEIRTWISWINKYGTLYAPSLNSYSVFRSCQSGSIENLKSTFEQLLFFWIAYHKRLIDQLIPRMNKIEIFNMSDLDCLASYLGTLLAVPSADRLTMPIENQKLPVTIDAAKSLSAFKFLSPSLFDGLCDRVLIDEAASIYTIALNLVA